MAYLFITLNIQIELDLTEEGTYRSDSVERESAALKLMARVRSEAEADEDENLTCLLPLRYDTEVTARASDRRP